MKFVGRLLSFVTVLLILASLVIISGGILGRPLLLAAVPTGSMVPALHPGDLIPVLPTWLLSAPDIDGVVVFRTAHDHDWIVHRIVAGNGTDGFVTKGDANPVSDPFRVYRKDIAGVVPQWHGAPIRFPRLGALRMSEGPFSSPVVAGVALVLGIFLMIMDSRPRVRIANMRHRSSQPVTDSALLSLYMGLAATAFVATLVPPLTLSLRTPVAYEIVRQRPFNVTRAGQYLQGQPHVEAVVMTNPSPLPLLLVFSSDDPHLTYEPAWAIIPGSSAYTFHAQVDTTEAGMFHATLHTGVLIPLLPAAILVPLGKASFAAAAVVTALIPGAVIVCIGLVDRRSRRALQRLKLYLWVRVLH
jgi:signal peptidase